MSMQKNVSLAPQPEETTGGFSRQQAEALYALGYTQYSQGRYDDACQSFWMLVVYDNTDSRYHRGLASCLQMTGRWHQAMLAYSLAWSFKPDDPGPLFHLAECMLALQQVDEAREMLGEFLSETVSSRRYQVLHARAEKMLEEIRTAPVGGRRVAPERAATGAFAACH